MVQISLATLGRRKIIDFDNTPLPRVLTLFDLTTLGIGTTIGVGFYILGGDVAQSKAGPAVTISFLIAAITSVFAGLCYAEFGGRVPKAGSAYIYTYVCIGEFIAFVIGWNLILEYVIATASVASGFSHYIDAMAHDAISEALEEAMPMDVSFLGPYPDLLAAALVIVLSLILAFGVKKSSLMNNVMTVLNMFVVTYCIIAIATLAHPSYWSLSVSELNETCVLEDGNTTEVIDYGDGGFAPFGFEGIMAGAAACFYGFVGFDVIASTGEEAINPERNLPLSICLSLTVIFISYFGLGTVLTMALPYCLLDNEAPLVKLFEGFDMEVSRIVVSVGALFGFSASLFGAIFPMPRIIYAMASDGLLFRWLSVINQRFRSPIIATFVSGGLAAVMATFFDLEALINMMSIGTLQAYSIVALCVMLLRYAEDPADSELEQLSAKGADTPSVLPVYRASVASSTSKTRESFSFKSYMHQAFNPKRLKRPTPLSASYVAWATVAFCLLCFIDCILLVVLFDKLKDLDPASVFFVIFFFVCGSLVVVTIYLQPQSSAKIQFKSPFVPWLPSLSCFFNLYLMCNLPPNTWVKFVVWLAIGFAIYFFYGICHSDANNANQPKKSGQSNAGFEEDSSDPVIPEILVQLATPMPSQNSTVVDDPPPVKRRSSREAVISPEVSAELAQKLQENEEGSQKDMENTEDKPNDEEHPVIIPKEPLIVGCAPPLRGYTNEEERQSQPENIGSEENKVVSTQNTDEPSLTNENGDGVSPLLVGAVVGVAVHQESAKSDSELEGKIAEATSSHNDTNNIDMKNSQSAPVIPVANASLDNIENSSENVFLEDAKTPSSVPATPVTKRPVNKDKPLRRMSSFDVIPPSSPTDPLAKKVNGFYVIPVKEDLAADDQQINKTSSDGENEDRAGKQAVKYSESSHGLGHELGKESIELGVIRERGESKILANDENFEALSSTRAQSESTTDGEKKSNSKSEENKTHSDGSQAASSPLATKKDTESIAAESANSETAPRLDNVPLHFDLGAASSTESLTPVDTKGEACQ